MNRDTWCLKSTLCSPSATSARKASNHDCSVRIHFWIPYSSFILHHSSITTDICHSPFLILLRQSSVISGILLRLLSHQLSILVSIITDNVKININIQHQYRYNAYNAYSLYMTTMTITTKIKDKQIKKEQSAAKKQHTHTEMKRDNEMNRFQPHAVNFWWRTVAEPITPGATLAAPAARQTTGVPPGAPVAPMMMAPMPYPFMAYPPTSLEWLVSVFSWNCIFTIDQKKCVVNLVRQGPNLKVRDKNVPRYSTNSCTP